MRVIIFILFIIPVIISQGQTVVWAEDFNTGGAGWSLNVTEGNNDPLHNIWIINGLQPVGDSPSGGNLLHISCNSNDSYCSVYGGPGCVYNAGGITPVNTGVMAKSDAISTLGHSNLTLSFWYQSKGQIGYDYGSVRYSVDNGITWISFPDKFANQSAWTQYSIALPVACENIATFRIGFFWQNNDDATGNDPAFCVDDIQITSPSSTAPNADFSVSETSICAFDCISIFNNSTGSNNSYSWFFPGGVPSSSTAVSPGQVCYNNPGTYTMYLTVTDQSSQFSKDSISITVNSNSPALITAFPQQGMAPLSVQISSTALAGECTWSVEGMTFSNISALSHIFTSPGNYDVCLVTHNASGCTDSSCTTIVVYDQLSQDTSFLLVPNVFTPNGDQQNDFFITTSQNIAVWDVKIYNRWGNQVYSGANPDIKWDGSSDGKVCADGVYVYIIKATGSDGKTYDLSGTLTLFR